ncbi:response regulator transcription factor [Pseudoalteromonas mariniglutinosa]|uniref:response regulator transcription factor n=1 Tax=Pseudoalteromonas mariniglutinosa TaxID=206042 RepID=UPI00385046B2
MKILLVEDELDFADSLIYALEKERFVTDHVTDIRLAREAVVTGRYDIILLDRTLPDGDGLSFIPELRANNLDVPVIVLSALGELTERIEGLDEGADDYLAKPFAFEEMLARVRAVRRRPASTQVPEIRVGKLVFDVLNEEAAVDGIRLVLTRREVRVLSSLIKRHGRVLLREILEQAVYGFNDEVQPNTLDSHVSRVRRKLIEAAAGVEIHAIRGVGYILRAEI